MGFSEDFDSVSLILLDKSNKSGGESGESVFLREGCDSDACRCEYYK